MEEQIKQTNPTLHKYLFTVTTFSKLLAMFFFILFPFVGFYLGMKYQETKNIIPNNVDASRANSNINQEEPEPTPFAIILDNSEPFKEYVNENYALSVPVKWLHGNDQYLNYDTNIPNSDFIPGIDNKKLLRLYVQNLGLNYDLKTTINEYKTAGAEINNITVGGITSTQVIFSKQTANYTPWSVFVKNNKGETYLIAITNNFLDYKDLGYKILSTFKFTN